MFVTKVTYKRNVSLETTTNLFGDIHILLRKVYIIPFCSLKMIQNGYNLPKMIQNWQNIANFCTFLYKTQIIPKESLFNSILFCNFAPPLKRLLYLSRRETAL